MTFIVLFAGNGVTVNVVYEIGKAILKEYKRQ